MTPQAQRLALLRLKPQALRSVSPRLKPQALRSVSPRLKRAAVMAESAMPTAERLKQAAGAFDIGGDKRSGRVFRMLDAPLEILFSAKKLTDLEYESLRRLRMHWTLGLLSGSLQSADFNRVADHLSVAAQSEREIYHREMFNIGWVAMVPLERATVGAVALNEIALAIVGAALGYQSPYRARSVVLELMQSGAARIAQAWKL